MNTLVLDGLPQPTERSRFDVQSLWWISKLFLSSWKNDDRNTPRQSSSGVWLGHFFKLELYLSFCKLDVCPWIEVFLHYLITRCASHSQLNLKYVNNDLTISDKTCVFRIGQWCGSMTRDTNKFFWTTQ